MDGKLTILVSLETGVAVEYFSNAAWTPPSVLKEYVDIIDENWGNGDVITGFSDSVTAYYTAYLKGKIRIR
jgi:hypothetical protein